MKRITRIFLTGLVAILPLAGTVAVLYWLGSSAEAFLGRSIRLVLPAHFYVPGLGLAAGAVLIFLVGLLMEAWFVRRLFSIAEWLLGRTPLVRTIYNALRDFADYFYASGQRRLDHQPVIVRLPGGGRVLGLVTRDDFSDIPGALGGSGDIAVYLPMSYQIGGYTLILSRDSVEPIDMPVEDALRFVLTGGISRSGRPMPTLRRRHRP
ncbi:MAG TPA: DUF502 domain-containing protein [Gammaproteobacteria bacterium]|nr:DUF502 domain-containing protein [Gammaproteobacteria bacterium]